MTQKQLSTPRRTDEFDHCPARLSLCQRVERPASQPQSRPGLRSLTEFISPLDDHCGESAYVSGTSGASRGGPRPSPSSFLLLSRNPCLYNREGRMKAKKELIGRERGGAGRYGHRDTASADSGPARTIRATPPSSVPAVGPSRSQRPSTVPTHSARPVGAQQQNAMASVYRRPSLGGKVGSGRALYHPVAFHPSIHLPSFPPAMQMWHARKKKSSGCGRVVRQI
ncbi:hypothetical protein GGR56DRAFT_268996 [Xylariaceae sp. FL0804]|nr:hypothetical protein GGR56DRAFT_268996 [Xylariaceae sp. FL0804]